MFGGSEEHLQETALLPQEEHHSTEPSSNNPLLRISNLSVAYSVEGARIAAIDGVNLDVRSGGHTIGVVGESGSGKTTLGLSIMNLIQSPGRIESGNIDFKGRNVLEMSDRDLRKYRWQEVAMVYQSAMNSLNPVKRITDPIVEVLREHTQISRLEAIEKARNLLKEVGIPSDFFTAFPHELSGGMRQRELLRNPLRVNGSPCLR